MFCKQGDPGSRYFDRLLSNTRRWLAVRLAYRLLNHLTRTWIYFLVPLYCTGLAEGYFQRGKRRQSTFMQVQSLFARDDALVPIYIVQKLFVFSL